MYHGLVGSKNRSSGFRVLFFKGFNPDPSAQREEEERHTAATHGRGGFGARGQGGLKVSVGYRFAGAPPSQQSLTQR